MKVDSAANDTVTADKSNASKGTTVIVTATPKDVKTVPVTKVGNGKYTFTMPEGGVTVNDSFKTPAQYFTDASGDWYQE